MKKNTKGFTLIELLIVMAIIGILAGLTAFNFQQARQRARDAERKNDLKQLQTALEIYKNDQTYPDYPDSLTDLTSLMSSIPEDPMYELNETWLTYDYTHTGTRTYQLRACLENKSDKDGSGACNSNNGIYYSVSQP
ncbi:type II secretion system protein [Candidatus Collierbacteria bacterium]|nr:type II secretion system protein [Candidatus Collierbacteria bacterium]